MTLTLNSCSPARAFTYSLSRPGVVDGAAASSRGGAMAASTATASPTSTQGADASGRASSCSMSSQTATLIRLSEVSSRNCAKQRQASFDEAGRSSNLLTYSRTHLLTYSLTHLLTYSLPPLPPSPLPLCRLVPDKGNYTMLSSRQFGMSNLARQSLTDALVPKELARLGVEFAKGLGFPGPTPLYV